MSSHQALVNALKSEAIWTRPFSIMLAFFSAFFGKTSIFFVFS